MIERYSRPKMAELWSEAEMYRVWLEVELAVVEALEHRDMAPKGTAETIRKKAKVDPARAHWWEVFGTVRWGIICHTQAWKHLSGSLKSMEMASIGRRAVETEVDLLQLLKAAR